jgi:hypothetical protein
MPRKGATVFRPIPQKLPSLPEAHAHLGCQAARQLSKSRVKTPDAAVQVCESLAAHEEDAEPDAYDPLTLHCQSATRGAGGRQCLLARNAED